jgi:hypothetical protein
MTSADIRSSRKHSSNLRTRLSQRLLVLTPCIEEIDAPTHPPRAPQHHGQDRQVGELPEHDEQERSRQRCCVGPSLGGDVEEDDVVDDEDVS